MILHKRNVTWVPGKDTERFKCKADARFFFGLEEWAIIARFPDPEPSLVYNIHARRGGLVVEQQSFAVPLLMPIQHDDWAGDDPMVALVRFRFRNENGDVARTELAVRYSQDSRRTECTVPASVPEPLRLVQDQLRSEWEGKDVLRCTFATDMVASETAYGALFATDLNPREACEVVLKIPYIALDSAEELEALESLEFERCHGEVTSYWREVGSRGATIQTPEPQLAALHRAHVAHVQVTDFAMPDDGDLVNTSVGSSTYGNFTNESCMIVHELDERGLHEEARRRLDLWVKYQGTVPQPGNFTDHEGLFYGAGGFEQGAYNQHHGWVLWAIAEHYFLSGDQKWFERVAGSAVEGADWVFRQRRNTMTDLPHSRGWETGFLPAGSLEDVTDFYYWLSTNALTWRGVDSLAQALEAVCHEEAPRVREEADAYRADLLRGFETMRQHSPLIRLRNGRWVPHYPSRLYRRGREIGWIRETLEGSVYLLLSGLYDVESQEAQWILDDFQDTRYPGPPFGYEIPDFEANWFARAGLSMQPNLLAGLLPYLERDQPELCLWMFYNCWCACYREEINAMVEHPAPVLGYSNTAHFKTSDQANAVSWLRYLFVYASNNLLHLGRAIPWAWFAQPEPFEAMGVATRFGEVGVRYEPHPETDTARAVAFLDFRMEPRRVMVRFRHPEKRQIQTVLVNGEPISHFDAAGGDVDLSGYKARVEIEVSYENR
jgi:hypothetical protein